MQLKRQSPLHVLHSCHLLCAGANGELDQPRGKASLQQQQCDIRLGKVYHETTLRDNQTVLPAKHGILISGSLSKSFNLHFPNSLSNNLTSTLEANVTTGFREKW